jgi:hypothetical protein
LDEAVSKLHEFQVTLPVAGTAFITVLAESEEDAIEQALDTVTLDHLEEWEALRQIVRGNVCYAPTWDADAVDCGPVDDDPALLTARKTGEGK